MQNSVSAHTTPDMPTAKSATKTARKSTGGTPGNVRTANSKTNLIRGGGRRMTVNLTGQGVQDLQAVREAGQHPNDTAAVHAALATVAAKIKPRSGK